MEKFIFPKTTGLVSGEHKWIFFTKNPNTYLMVFPEHVAGMEVRLLDSRHRPGRNQRRLPVPRLRRGPALERPSDHGVQETQHRPLSD